MPSQHEPRRCERQHHRPAGVVVQKRQRQQPAHHAVRTGRRLVRRDHGHHEPQGDQGQRVAGGVVGQDHQAVGEHGRHEHPRRHLLQQRARHQAIGNHGQQEGHLHHRPEVHRECPQAVDAEDQSGKVSQERKGQLVVRLGPPGKCDRIVQLEEPLQAHVGVHHVDVDTGVQIVRPHVVQVERAEHENGDEQHAAEPRARRPPAVVAARPPGDLRDEDDPARHGELRGRRHVPGAPQVGAQHARERGNGQPHVGPAPGELARTVRHVVSPRRSQTRSLRSLSTGARVTRLGHAARRMLTSATRSPWPRA